MPLAIMPQAQEFAGNMTAELGLPEGLLKAVPEDVCCPEFKPGLLYMRRRPDGHLVISGWVKQQLVKLACAEIIKTPFYLVSHPDMLLSEASVSHQTLVVI